MSFMNYREFSQVVATMTHGLGARTSQREGCAAALLGGILWTLTGCIAPPTVLPNTCGDGFVSEDEECDDPEMSVDCNIDCTWSRCGDGLANPAAGERCDDGNDEDGDGCSASCGFEGCGNGVVEPGERCDDGNREDGDDCSASCGADGACGNGAVDPGEACDDGNAITGDGCGPDCRLENCGNGLVEPGETCDHGGVPTETCDSDCTAVACGDGVINKVMGEQCDDGDASESCDEDCTIARCGDRVINTVAGETCDEGGADTVSCDRDCTARSCGDGFVNALAGEQCDAMAESEFCDADCTILECGDGEHNETAGEECDDGNREDEDGCSSHCEVEVSCQNAGDGVPECAGLAAWGRRFGGVDSAGALHIAVDSADSILLTGYFYGTVDFGGGPLVSASGSDAFVVKLDAQGQHLWSRSFRATGDENVDAIAVDSAGNVLLVGSFAGTLDFGGGPLLSDGPDDMFVVKLDAQGQHLWSNRFGASGSTGRYGDAYSSGIAVDSAGNVLLSGYFDGELDFGGGPLVSVGWNDAFLIKLDAQGQHLWSNRFGGPDRYNRTYATDVAVDSAGNVLLIGSFSGTVDFGGGPLFGSDGYDAFAVKLDAQGQHLWSNRFGVPGDSGWYGFTYASSIAVDSAGNVLLTGEFDGEVDFGGGSLFSAGGYDAFAVKLDAQGQHLWSNRSGTDNNEHGQDIAVDGAGNALFTGSEEPDYGCTAADDAGGCNLLRSEDDDTLGVKAAPLHSDSADAWVIKLDAQGQFLWSNRSGGEGDDESRGIAVDSAGNVLFTGSFEDTADFGGLSLSSAGESDIFVVKLHR